MKNDILEAAEKLLLSQGYKQTSLNDIAIANKMKPASLYYHFPGGKEEIYIEVLRKRMSIYKQKIQEITTSGKDLREIFLEFSNWYLDQPPMNMTLISELDMPQLTLRGRKEIMALVSESLFTPLKKFIIESQSQFKNIDAMRIVGIYISLLNGMATATKQNYTTRDRLVADFTEIFLHGVIKS